MLLFDVETPREVWAEYEERKAAFRYGPFMWDYATACQLVADELGAGVPPDELTDEQREAQRAAIEKHGGRCDR